MRRRDTPRGNVVLSLRDVNEPVNMLTTTSARLEATRIHIGLRIPDPYSFTRVPLLLPLPQLLPHPTK